jgi:cytoskeletal protein CcmA (bactofilin family)
MFRRGDIDERHEAIEAGEVRAMNRSSGNGEVTVVGQGARLEGSIVSAGSLRIDGQVKGRISAEGDVSLSPQSQVEADIQAQNVMVAGTFKGSIVAKAKAELSPGGRVDGNITSKTLIVAEGATFSGQSIMGGQDGRGDGGRTQPQPSTATAPPAPGGPPGGDKASVR